MTKVRCPQCNKLNPDSLENCQFCGAPLKPADASGPGKPSSIQPGENPVKKNTSEFDKVTFPPGEKGTIHPGDAPTKKNTGELERALPSWLRSLRGKDQGAGNAPEQPAPDDHPLAAPEMPPPVDKVPVLPPSNQDLPNWISGLSSTAAEDEQVPEWLSDLRGPAGVDAAPAKPESAPEESLSDWMASLGSHDQSPASQPPAARQPPAVSPPATTPEEGLPDWVERLQQSGNTPPGDSKTSEVKDTGELTAWLSNLPSSSAADESPAAPAEDAPDWLNKLKEKSGEPESAPPFDVPVESDTTPDWLANLQPGRGAQEVPPTAPAESGSDWQSNLQPGPEAPQAEFAAAADSSPDWLSSLQPGPEAQSAGTATAADSNPDWLASLQPAPEEPSAGPAPAAPAESTPSWLSSLQPESEAPAAAPAENIPDWLSKMETSSGPGAGEPVPPAFTETPSSPPTQAGGAAPDWLANLQAEANAASVAESRKEEFEVASEPAPSQAPSESLPDWLSTLEKTAPPAAETPAMIIGDQEKATAGEAKAAFSMETPDWLSKLKPDQAGEKGKATAAGEEDKSSDSLRPADLPSWVQAMRPVESVVAEAKATPVEEGQVTEDRGPLAGLRAVLPATPGLGPLRKPPAYAIKLQATDSQQRYAGHLEKLISAELSPAQVNVARPMSERLLRVTIALVLILAVMLPIATKVQLTPANALYPPEMVAAYSLIGSLPANAPVLVVFDYEPALSGELEAAAAPVIDHLLFSGARLALISTSPTGPALAEHFMSNTQAEHNYQSGQQYVNLGYLAGGQAGVLYFATSPKDAAKVAFSSDPNLPGKADAWQLPPLAGINRLSDFQAVLVLTDSADTARIWIEQAGPSLGTTPMAMVISAQAEPMVLPYYLSGQLKGLVTGLAGGRAYEQAVQHTTLGQTYWNAISVGLLVVELTILAGAAWSLFSAWLSRRKTKPGEEA